MSEVPRTWGSNGPGVYAEWGTDVQRRKSAFPWRVTESSAEEAAFQLFGVAGEVAHAVCYQFRFQISWNLGKMFLLEFNEI